MGKSTVPPPDQDELAADQPMGHTPFTPLGVDNDKPSNEAKAEVMAQIPLLRDQLKRFDRKIAALENYSNISDATLTDPVKFMHIVAGRRAAVLYIKTERDYLQRKVDKVLSKQ